MKEKYIFFILFIIALILFIGGALNQKAKDEVSLKELAIERKIKHLQQKKQHAQQREKD